MLIDTLDALSPMGATKEALSTPAGLAVLLVLLLLLLTAVILIVKKVNKMKAAQLSAPAEKEDEHDDASHT